MRILVSYALQSGDMVTTRSQSGESPFWEAVTVTGCRTGDNPHRYWLVTVSPLFFRGSKNGGS